MHTLCLQVKNVRLLGESLLIVYGYKEMPGMRIANMNWTIYLTLIVGITRATCATPTYTSLKSGDCQEYQLTTIDFGELHSVGTTLFSCST